MIVGGIIIFKNLLIRFGKKISLILSKYLIINVIFCFVEYLVVKNF